MNKFLVFILLFFFINGTFVVAFNPVLASEISKDSWYVKKPMSQARYGLGVVAVEGKIYAIGGYGVDGYVAVNECYDPKTDTWVTLKSMPTPRRDFGIVAYEGKIYCIGGGAAGERGLIALLNTNEVYDIATDSWSTKAVLPFNGRSLHAHVVAGKIFVSGARDSFKYGSPHDLYMYDPVEDVWIQKTTMPKQPPAGSFIVSAVVDDKIMFAGEFVIGDIEQQMVWIYNTTTDNWSDGMAGTTRVWEGSAGATTGIYAPKKVYTLGITSNAAYDPADGSWSSVKAMPTERAGFGVAVVEDVLYVIGGFTSDDFHSFGSTYVPIALNEQYVPLGYHGTLSPTISSTTAPTPSNSPVPTESKPESEHSGSLLTRLVVATTVILTCIVIATLFFYQNGKNKSVKYE
jgi:N-acetylneuraminic acid mutarotase